MQAFKSCAFPNSKIAKFPLVDHIKIVIKDIEEIDRIWNDERLIWWSKTEELSASDWELIRCKEKKVYKNLKFGKTDFGLYIIFSPHIYRNNGLHNADDFPAYDCIHTIKCIIEFFKIVQCEKWKIINLEMGLNFIMPGYGPDLVMFTEYWKKTLFKYDRSLAFCKKAVNQRNGRDCTYKRLKMYCKYSHEPDHCKPDTVRLEICSGQTKYIKGKLGIDNIGCLLNPKVYETFKSELVQVVKEMLILDHKTGFENLNKDEKLKMLKYLSNNTWYRQTLKSVNGFWQMKQRYFQLLDKTGSNIHLELLQIIQSKLNDLTRQTCLNSIPNQNSLKHMKTCLNSNVIKGGNPTYEDLSKYRCNVTGLNLIYEGRIKVGNPIPNYIRISTLRYLQQNDPKAFERLRLDLIPNNCSQRPKYETSLLAHLSKQIRNRFYNSNKIKKVGYNQPKAQPNEQLDLYEALGLEPIQARA